MSTVLPTPTPETDVTPATKAENVMENIMEQKVLSKLFGKKRDAVVLFGCYYLHKNNQILT